MREKVAVCVGINDYPGTGADLSGCVNDAKDWEKALAARGYETAVLLDSDATKANVVAALREALARCTLGDRFVFTYSGHGTWVPDRDGDEVDRRDEALVMHDYQRGPSGLLSDDESYALFQERASGVRVTVISDSCHSGTMARFMGGAPVEARPRFISPVDLGLDVTEDEAVALEQRTRNAPSRPGTVLISGCQDHEYSYDAVLDGRPNGAMSYHLLRSLDARYTDSVYRTLRTKLPTAQYPQTPVLTASFSQRLLPLL